MLQVSAQLRARLIDEADNGQPLAVRGDRVAAILGRSIPHDGWVIITFDPLSGLRSASAAGHSLNPSRWRGLALNELAGEDANRFAVLAKQHVPAGVLRPDLAAGRTSERLADLLRPEGFGSELRVCILHRHRLCAAVILLRGTDVPAFCATDALLAAQVLSGSGALFGPVPTRARADEEYARTGLVILDRQLRMRWSNPAATPWLSDVHPGQEDGSSEVLRVLADAVLVSRLGADPPTSLVRQSATGRWMVV